MAIRRWQNAVSHGCVKGQTWTHGKVEFLPIIKPHCSDSRRILQNDVGDTAGERIWTFVSENMTHMRAWGNLKDTAALPNLLCGPKLILIRRRQFYGRISFE